MRPYVRKIGFVILLALISTSWNSAPSHAQVPGQWADPTFRHTAPLQLLVTRVSVIEDYIPPLADPNVDHLFPIIPAQFMQAWTRDRLQGMGGLHTGRMRIMDASVTEQPLDVTSGWKDIFVNEQAEKYVSNFKARLEILDSQTGTVAAWVEAAASHSQTVPESASIDEREAAYLGLTETTMASLNDELVKQINTHLKSFLVGP